MHAPWFPDNPPSTLEWDPSGVTCCTDKQSSWALGQFGVGWRREGWSDSITGFLGPVLTKSPVAIYRQCVYACMRRSPRYNYHRYHIDQIFRTSNNPRVQFSYLHAEFMHGFNFRELVACESDATRRLIHMQWSGRGMVQPVMDGHEALHTMISRPPSSSR